MTHIITLADELKDIYFAQNRETKVVTADIQKINFMTVYNWGYTVPIILRLDVVFLGETEIKHVSAVYYSTEEKVPSDIYVSMLSDFASSSNVDYNLRINLAEANPESNNYFLEYVSVFIDDNI
ncbi:hypothetical protein [Klebsiella sp. BIGb0407]|uniref:hypothetical protein n=1 Tax=Klebsiella sp. BIGb0407 TaxID=2940603 RepID=UPI00216750FF|nr:hypothetical protein [Klebsiella sp. BIGb0407]MCS3433844.1 hypothetical protein [Klebsiella sp. BIGb0407]